MFRKLTLIAIPAAAFALTLFASVDSASARGPIVKRVGFHHEHRGIFRKEFRFNRHWDRFAYRYPSFGFVEAPIYTAPVTVAPVVETPIVETPIIEAPVVEAPVVEAPVVEEPVVSNTPTIETEIGARHIRKDFPRRERPLERGGKIIKGKK
jgi:hypothetical protein